MSDSDTNGLESEVLGVHTAGGIHPLHVLVFLIFTPLLCAAPEYMLIGPRAFRLNFWSAPFISMGIGAAIVYIMYKLRGLGLAVTTALFLALVNAVCVSKYFLSTAGGSFEVLVMVPLLCHVLKVWKIDKPAYGRMLLLGPLCGVILGLHMLLIRSTIFGAEHALETSIRQSLLGFRIGVGLGLGLELSEWINKRIPEPRSLLMLVKRAFPN